MATDLQHRLELEHKAHSALLEQKTIHLQGTPDIARPFFKNKKSIKELVSGIVTFILFNNILLTSVAVHSRGSYPAEHDLGFDEQVRHAFPPDENVPAGQLRQYES